ncbi:MAG: hypothetical protein J6Y87_01660 [Muribaculaceae bacterium]|nr:hypothetical protein [Muribaculaceae bacterium]
MDFWHDWPEIPPSRLVAHYLPCQIVPNTVARFWHDHLERGTVNRSAKF